MLARTRTYLEAPVSIAPLATFRAVFGAVMFVSVLRFVLKGWVHDLYVKPGFFFGYWGFEWLKPLGETGMYLVFGIMAMAALGIGLGAFYRISAVLFFLAFTYVELLDKSNYLNHYYFVSVVAFLLIWVPANGRFSVDVLRNPALRRTEVPRWCVGAFRLQLGMVYWFAGFAKLNPDWLFEAQPLRMWLPAKSHLPVIGTFLGMKWVAFAFAWFGAIYDLFVPFFLSIRKTRPFAYAAVVVFHLMTWWLFQIGMFPFIMILATLVFFPGEWHERIWLRLGKMLKAKENKETALGKPPRLHPWLMGGMALFFTFQLLFPFRYLLYPGDLFWTEQGYRFSWRVMLMEKAGHASFRVRDPRNGGESEIDNRAYLTPNQERMMASQPDMILQFAHFLAEEYKQKGIPDPEVYADVHVALNGRGSRRYIDPTRDLSKETESFAHKDWILPFESPKLAAK